MFYFSPRPALAYCRTPFSKSTRQPWRPTRLGGSNISATLHRSLATSRSVTGRTRSLYGWTIDSAPASCAPSCGAKRAPGCDRDVQARELPPARLTRRHRPLGAPCDRARYLVRHPIHETVTEILAAWFDRQ